MPTGYTAILLERPDTSFPEFALRCARAFSALVQMRDSSLDAEFPDEIKPDDSYRTSLEEAYAKARELEVLTLDEAARRAEEEYQRDFKSKAEAEERWADENKIFAAMLAKVNEWEPPTQAHEGLKKFMAEQIAASMHRSFSWHVERKTAAVWLAQARSNAVERVLRATDDWAREQRSAREKTQWLRELRASLSTGGDT